AAAGATSLCYQCGPAAPATHGALCGTSPNLVCCASGQVCLNGVCADTCSSPSTCDVPSFCTDGCLCVQTVDQGNLCVGVPQSPVGGASSADCGTGSVCGAALGDCFNPVPVCFPTGPNCFFGCFIAGTRVTMADGTEKPVEQIRVGDQVLGREGEVNHVVDVERPLLGSRKLYSLNGSQPFVTAGHPFMNSEGWKA